MISPLARIAARAIRALPVVHADFAPLTAIGVGLVPGRASTPEVRLKWEQVDIYLYPMVAVVELEFELVNEGPTVEFEVGFPCLGEFGGPYSRTEDPLDFAVTVDGSPVATRKLVIPGGDSPRPNPYAVAFPMWFAWSQRFEAGKTVRLRARYWNFVLHYTTMASRAPFQYILRTGGLWKGGCIGEATVRVHARGVPLSAIREATPAGYEIDRDERRLTWTFRDWKPDTDLGILVSPLNIVASKCGIELDELIDVVENPPPTGTIVTVAGIVHVEGILSGERFLDDNIVIPDGIRAYGHESLEARLFYVEPEGLLRKAISQSGMLSSRIVRGVIERTPLGPVLHATEIWESTFGGPGALLRGDAELRERFPWVSLEYPTNHERVPGNAGWPQPRRKHGDRWGERCRVPHPAPRSGAGEPAVPPIVVPGTEVAALPAPQEQLQVAGNFWFAFALLARVEGDCQSPEVLPGDLILACKLRRYPRAGEFILVRSRGRLLLRRTLSEMEPFSGCFAVEGFPGIGLIGLRDIVGIVVWRHPKRPAARRE